MLTIAHMVKNCWDLRGTAVWNLLRFSYSLLSFIKLTTICIMKSHPLRETLYSDNQKTVEQED